MNYCTPARRSQDLGNAAAELRGYAGERSADARGQSLHAGSRTESNQSNDQSLLDQVLTVLQRHQALQSEDELVNPLHKPLLKTTPSKTRQNPPFAREGSS